MNPSHKNPAPWVGAQTNWWRIPLKVNAKTGTLHFVSALAGYVTTPDGRELAFAIFGADVNARDRLIGPDRERPQGARTYNGRAKKLQQKLIERWGTEYGA